MNNEIFAYLSHFSRLFALKSIRFYQKTLSLDHGPLKKVFPFGRCRFHPTCSEYAYQAVAKYGLIKGFFMGFKRFLRCHPFSKGGHDPVK